MKNPLFSVSKIFISKPFLTVLFAVLCIGINRKVFAVDSTINGVVISVTGTGSSIPNTSSPGLISQYPKCNGTTSSTTAYYVGVSSGSTGTLKIAAATKLTQLDVYVAIFNAAERLVINPPAGVTVTAVCGISAKGNNTYGGMDFPIDKNGSTVGYTWQHLRFTSSTANAFTTISLITTAVVDGFVIFIPVDGAVPICTIPASITQHPVATQKVCVISNYSFSVGATGNNLVYNWEYSADGSTNWIPIMQTSIYNIDNPAFQGANTATLTATGNNTGQDGRYYRVIVKNSCNTVTSNMGRIFISNYPVVTEALPSVKTICAGSEYTWSIGVSGDNLQYNWKYADVNDPTFKVIDPASKQFSGSNSATLTVKGGDGLVQDKRRYLVNISNGYCNFESNAGKISVTSSLPAPTFSAAKASNTCPIEHVDMTTYVTSTTPAGSSIRWFSTEEIFDPQHAGSNSFRAYYYKSDSDGTCLSPASTTLVVDIVNCIALPVNLLSFKVRELSNGINELVWATTQEKNNDFFEIEVSTDARNFYKISLVKGHGNLNFQHNYNFVDTNPLADLVYYRLKQVDFDGAFEYSKIVAVQNRGLANAFVVYPNPVQGELALKLHDSKIVKRTSMFDSNGMKVFFQNSSSRLLQIADLKSGIYVINVETTDGKSFRQRFLKR